MQSAKTKAKKLKIALGGGTELEDEQADEELGIKPDDKSKSTKDDDDDSPLASPMPASKYKENLFFVRVTLESKAIAEKLLGQMFKQ